CFDGERKDDFDFSRLHFLNNWALGFGGGAMVRIGRIDGSSILELSNCDFTRNASRVRNGALLIDTRQLLYTKSVLIKKCHFIENDTLPTMQVTFGEANAVIGISLLGLDNSGSILLSDCNIRKNRTKNNSYIVNIDFYDIKMLQVEKSVFAENFYVSVQKVRVNPGLL
ncbi:MAG TPA: hypothetical protein PLO42_21165, partial [Cyclobacteriaceae bacterium]|nr:hypothetical protein [Cyclobacteriaceae bacterium]